MLEFQALRKLLKTGAPPDAPKVKLALLGDSATQLLSQAIKGFGISEGLAIEVWEAEFDQIERQLFDNASDYHRFGAQVTVIFKSTRKLSQRFDKLPPAERANFAAAIIAETEALFAAVKKGGGKAIVCNFPEEDDGVFGQFASKTAASFIWQLRKLNVELQELAARNPDLFVCDLSKIQNELGRPRFFDAPIYINTEMAVSVAALPFAARAIVQIVAALRGSFKKCLICDLDNTLWGGVIGDDGLANIQVGQLGIGKAFCAIQRYVKKLRERGIIICVCSKNDDAVAREPFEKHPDMVLRMEDIAVFTANWENKADNIRKIQRVLNIGLDSMVFLDDNPFERNLVRKELPQVLVPELPDDPALWPGFFSAENFFETAAHSEADAKRTEQYQKEAARAVFHEKFTNEDDYLGGLEMVSDAKPFDAFSAPRVAQLSQRSNQFNLRTIRYTEDDIRRIASSPDHLTLSLTLRDKFGDNGLVCALILEKRGDALFIDTWFMSCRVLKRGMEAFTLNTIAALARANRFNKIIGEYLPTAKNGMVRDHYKQLGFHEDGGLWTLKLNDFKPIKTHIQPSAKETA
jgi:FkbH-like protein